MTEKTRNESNQRVQRILETELNSVNHIEATNTSEILAEFRYHKLDYTGLRRLKYAIY